MALNTVTTVNDDGTVTVTPAGSTPTEIARGLLDAADRPAQVRTISGGWLVPKKVAQAAGLISAPKPKPKPRQKRVSDDGGQVTTGA